MHLGSRRIHGPADLLREYGLPLSSHGNTRCSTPGNLHTPSILHGRTVQAYNGGMSENTPGDETPLFCARCGVELRPGTGNFYLVRIEAMADPSPPRFSEDDLKQDPRAEIERLFRQMSGLSERELIDQVYRRLVVYLCGPCYRQWIEDIE